MDEKYWEAAELLALGQSVDPEFSPWQLERWRKAHLLPEPIRRWFGPPHQGSVTLYPPGSDRQLLAILAIREHRMPLPHIAMRLWLDGFPIPLATMRDAMHEAFAPFHRLAGKAARDPEVFSVVLREREVTASPWLVAARQSFKRLLQLGGRAVRGNANAAQRSHREVERFTRLVAEVGTGNAPSGPENDIRVLAEVGLGLNEPPAPDRVMLRWYRSDIVQELHGLAATLPQIIRAWRTATDNEFEQARSDVQPFRRLGAALEQFAEHCGLTIQGANRLRGVRADSPQVSAVMLTTLIWARRTMPGNVDTVVGSIREFVESAEQGSRVLHDMPADQRERAITMMRSNVRTTEGIAELIEA